MGRDPRAESMMGHMLSFWLSSSFGDVDSADSSGHRCVTICRVLPTREALLSLIRTHPMLPIWLFFILKPFRDQLDAFSLHFLQRAANATWPNRNYVVTCLVLKSPKAKKTFLLGMTCQELRDQLSQLRAKA